MSRIAGSLSGNIMEGVCRFGGNDSGKPSDRIQARFTFPVIGLVAIVETVVVSIFTMLSILTLPFTKKYNENCIKRLKSSSFTILWSLLYSLNGQPKIGMSPYETYENDAEYDCRKMGILPKPDYMK